MTPPPCYATVVAALELAGLGATVYVAISRRGDGPDAFRVVASGVPRIPGYYSGSTEAAACAYWLASWRSGDPPDTARHKAMRAEAEAMWGTGQWDPSGVG